MSVGTRRAAAIGSQRLRRAHPSVCLSLFHCCLLQLPYFLNLKKAEVGTPSLVCCLDSGCHNYEQVYHSQTQPRIFTARAIV